MSTDVIHYSHFNCTVHVEAGSRGEVYTLRVAGMEPLAPTVEDGSLGSREGRRSGSSKRACNLAKW